MSVRSTIFKRAAIVVAHPDDEALWFSSVLEQAALVCMCFLEYPKHPEWTQSRRRAIAELSHKNAVALGIDEAGEFGGADWENPEVTECGMALPHATAEVRAAYEKNYRTLTQILRKELRGFENVFTHNPWGEYGHEGHVQVSRVVSDLAGELGCSVWYSGYVGERSRQLAQQFELPPAGSENVLIRSTNMPLAQKYMQIYQTHDVWTWRDDHVWPDEEVFLHQSAVKGPNRDVSHKTSHILTNLSSLV